MKKLKVFPIKLIAFSLIFICLFFLFQRVLRYKWDQHEFISTRMEYYSQEKENTIDVLFFGSSPVYADITPMIMWNETGITGVNFGTSMQNAVCNYYQVQYALTKQTPKVIVMDFAALLEDRKADELKYESTYRKIYETMPDKELKKQLLEDIIKDNEEQKKADYYFPLLRYHSRWAEVEKRDFVSIPWYKSYFKGGYLFNASKPIENKIVADEVELANKVNISEYSSSYYQKIIRMCKERNIPIVAVSFPNFELKDLQYRNQKLKEFCEENEIAYINYNEPENLKKLDLDLTRDFYDPGHMCLEGSIKLTTDLGNRLQEMYDLEDHRDDEKYNSWNEEWEKFRADKYFENIFKEDVE